MLLVEKVALESVMGFTALNVGGRENACNDLVDECQDLIRVGLNTERYYALPHRAAENLRPKPRAQNDSATTSDRGVKKSGSCTVM